MEIMRENLIILVHRKSDNQSAPVEITLNLPTELIHAWIEGESGKIQGGV